jgi:NTE family protein
MPDPLTRRPDVLVLAGGGTLGEAWMRGLLAGAEAGSAGGLDFRACEYFVGTSAGSIVAATLAAGRRPEAGKRVEQAYAAAADAAGTGEDEAVPELSLAARVGTVMATPFAPLALAATAPGGARLRAAALSRGPVARRTLDGFGRQLERLGATFDGRLRIAVVDRLTGRRVMLGAPGAPPASVAEAVLASCAIPWYFAPVVIDGREYVDGGAWSPTNLDASPVARDSEVLCLNPTAAAGPLRPFSRASAARESMVLRARGARVRVIAPDRGATVAIGSNLMDASRVDRVLDAAYAQGRRLA